jgi:urea transport system ATP-binding protein
MTPDTPHPDAGTGILLRLEQASVVFDGFKALDITALTVRDREVRVVIGPNGAGKTTLCDVISGKTRLKTGSVWFDGADVTHLTDYEIARRGVGRKFQTPTVFGTLTVAQNLELAAPGTKGVMQGLLRKASRALQDEVAQAAESVGLADALDVEAQYLSHGQRQSLEIGTLLMARPKLMLVDEPAAGLSDEETAAMARLLLSLAGRHTLIVIEHDMDFVRQLDADITVLSEGRVLAEGSLDAIQADERVIEAYLGR